MGSRVLAMATAVLACAVLAPAAHSAFPGQNGKIAFVGQGSSSSSAIWLINPDGNGEQELTSVSDPWQSLDWSPDGSKIAFVDGSDVYVINADGSGRTNITNTPFPFYERHPSWSPDGTRLAYDREPVQNGYTEWDIQIANPDGSNPQRLGTSGQAHSPEWSPDGTRIMYMGCSGSPCTFIPYMIQIDGSGETSLTEWGDWSPNGTKITFQGTAPGTPAYEVLTQNLDGSARINVSNDPASDQQPAWSPDGSKIVFWSGRGGAGPRIWTVNSNGTFPMQVTQRAGREPHWQPIPINSYARPKGASPLQTYLVPAYEPCTSPNRTHGPALAFGSCTPPTSIASLTVGTADANGKPSKSVSFVRFSTLTGNPATPADEADVQIEASITDVYDGTSLTDYGGSLSVETPLQITDKLNTPHPGGPGAGTVSQTTLGFPISCTPTADTTAGATCALSTTFEALVPGAVTEGRRSIWELGQVVVNDAGGQPFMREGLFVP